MFSNRRNFISNIVMMSNYNDINKFNVPKLYNHDFNSKESKIINLQDENIENTENNKLIELKRENKNKNKNNIYLTGPLTEESCFKLTETLINYNNKLITNTDLGNHINLYIQSPGGSLLPTLAVVDEIINLNIPVHTYIRGYAASAATLLSVVGKQRYIYNHSLFMIHGVKFGDENLISSYPELKDFNENAELFIKIIKNIYLENSNIDEKTLNEMFFHDKWMDSHQALKYGLVDEIL
tara:strand:- start:770 stop:1486 length:717 start_codon:yes stop_codon:yes gene_type:complete